MTIIDHPNKDKGLPDMDSLMNSIKNIHRAVPAVKDGAYSYFADSVNMSSTVADNVNQQITETLTTLPSSLEKLKATNAYAKNIAKINVEEKAGNIDANTAATGREQLEQRLNEGLSSIITSFDNNANDLSESAERLSKYSTKIEVRLKDSFSTETANYDRAVSDVERESARVDTLQTRYDKLSEAVDEKRGGPVDELLEIIPDEKELSSLLDVGAEDAAAPEVAAAKKAIELAVSQIKKVLGVVNKIVEFEQLVSIRDEVFKALQAQRDVSNAASDRLTAVNKVMGELGKVQSAGTAMGTVAEEVNKIVTTLSNFVSSLKNLDGQEMKEDTISNLYDSMNSYLEKVRIAKNNVILG